MSLDMSPRNTNESFAGLPFKSNPAVQAFDNNMSADTLAHLRLIKFQQITAQNSAQIEAIKAKSENGTSYNSNMTVGFDTYNKLQKVNTQLGATNPAVYDTLSKNDKVLANVIKQNAQEVQPGQEPSQPKENDLKAQNPFKPTLTR